MMSKKRTDLGFGEALTDLSVFIPTPKIASKDKSTQEVAEASGFVSREPKVQEQQKTQRRRRTGRNVQFNIKAKPETITAFYEIADANGWGLGETLEYAIDLLQRHEKSR